MSSPDNNGQEATSADNLIFDQTIPITTDDAIEDRQTQRDNINMLNNEAYSFARRRRIPGVCTEANASGSLFTVSGDGITADVDSVNEVFLIQSINKCVQLMIDDWKAYGIPKKLSQDLSACCFNPTFIVNSEIVAVSIEQILKSPESHTKRLRNSEYLPRYRSVYPTAHDFIYCFQRRSIKDVFPDGILKSQQLPYVGNRASSFFYEFKEAVNGKIVWHDKGLHSHDKKGAFYGKVDEKWHIIETVEVLEFFFNFTDRFFLSKSKTPTIPKMLKWSLFVGKLDLWDWANETAISNNPHNDR